MGESDEPGSIAKNAVIDRVVLGRVYRADRSERTVGSEVTVDAGDVADFREAIKKKSGIPINTQVPGIARSQPATLPDRLDIQTPAMG